ncbi:hypothetical protein [Enterococcus faecalis]|uniref:hypothetical protein n=1 Tax=Enterococcus faecalis TaxID=1351 RepID=UPI0001E975F0|nr:hypothetical protein [Enterococcus faecalis]EFQ71269.1 hypothetical protein HMPREF9510_00959 [Enterococcus faecalis TX0470]EOK03033.1 hypothetical protein WOM_00870 [Enterococcus faecalis EnGen0360]
MDPYDYLDADYEEHLKKECVLTITTKRKLYYWYRISQLYFFNLFNYKKFLKLQDFVLEELEMDIEKYFKIKVKEKV